MKIFANKKLRRISGAMFAVQLLAANAGAIQISQSSLPNAIIPDGDLNGLVDTIALTTSITSIGSVSVMLNITGGFNGDYYAYLRHTDSSGSALSVLLNRVGVSAGESLGSWDVGFNVTLSDAATLNVHDVAPVGSALTGTYQPDGRNISPLSDSSTLGATTPSAFLSSFNGMNANGTWELFIADAASGDIGTLTSWGITISDSATGVPDGGATLLSLGAGCMLLLFARKRFSGQLSSNP